jgi:hypothetical protein
MKDIVFKTKLETLINEKKTSHKQMISNSKLLLKENENVILKREYLLTRIQDKLVNYGIIIKEIKIVSLLWILFSHDHETRLLNDTPELVKEFSGWLCEGRYMMGDNHEKIK